jgi:hypothetical protein
VSAPDYVIHHHLPDGTRLAEGMSFHNGVLCSVIKHGCAKCSGTGNHPDAERFCGRCAGTGKGFGPVYLVEE